MVVSTCQILKLSGTGENLAVFAGNICPQNISRYWIFCLQWRISDNQKFRLCHNSLFCIHAFILLSFVLPLPYHVVLYFVTKPALPPCLFWFVTFN